MISIDLPLCFQGRDLREGGGGQAAGAAPGAGASPEWAGRSQGEDTGGHGGRPGQAAQGALIAGVAGESVVKHLQM